MKIPTNLVPQADNVNAIEIVIKAVADGAKTFQDMADALGYRPRQGRYYRLAGEILGFLKKKGTNTSSITPFGKAYINANAEQKKGIFAKALLQAPIFQRVIPFIESKAGNGITRNELASFIEKVTETTRGMRDRRAASILSWLAYADIVEKVKNGYHLLKLPESAPIVQYPSLIEPLLPNQFDLSEYKKIAQRTNNAQTTIKYEVNQAKKDRANSAHEKLVELVANRIKKANSIPKSNQLIDLAARIGNKRYIFEIKSTTKTNARSQIRRGISQLYEYRYFQNLPDSQLVLVIENPLPKNLKWHIDYLVEDREILLVWDGNNKLHCPQIIKDRLQFIF